MDDHDCDDNDDRESLPLAGLVQPDQYVWVDENPRDCDDSSTDCDGPMDAGEHRPERIPASLGLKFADVHAYLGPVHCDCDPGPPEGTCEACALGACTWHGARPEDAEGAPPCPFLTGILKGADDCDSIVYSYPGGPVCPGAGKCHGPVVWCDNCGDTADDCDDTDCDAHTLSIEECDDGEEGFVVFERATRENLGDDQGEIVYSTREIARQAADHYRETGEVLRLDIDVWDGLTVTLDAFPTLSLPSEFAGLIQQERQRGYALQALPAQFILPDLSAALNHDQRDIPIMALSGVVMPVPEFSPLAFTTVACDDTDPPLPVDDGLYEGETNDMWAPLLGEFECDDTDGDGGAL